MAELGIPVDKLYGWTKAAQQDQLDVGPGEPMLESAMSVVEKVTAPRKQVKELEKVSRRPAEKNKFWAEASAFIVASR